MITSVKGVRVGHWTDDVARTGCTAVLLPPDAVVSGEIRGGAPGTREWALLDPARRVEHVDAVMLTGGSAFGLAACDGAMRWCEEQGIGVVTPAGVVPIVVGIVIFDLPVGDPAVRPGPSEGYAACASATPEPIPSGAIGAGTGATVSKVRGLEAAQPGGLGSGLSSDGDVVVAALMVANAYGDVRPAGGFAPGAAPRPTGVGAPLEGSFGAPGAGASRGTASAPGRSGPLEATTIGVVVTNARLNKLQCLLVAQSGHDGLARALEPVHTGYDGDGLVVAASGDVDADVEMVRALAAEAVEAGIRDAVAAR